jgi:hypothetical protein
MNNGEDFHRFMERMLGRLAGESEANPDGSPKPINSPAMDKWAEEHFTQNSKTNLYMFGCFVLDVLEDFAPKLARMPWAEKVWVVLDTVPKDHNAYAYFLALETPAGGGISRSIANTLMVLQSLWSVSDGLPMITTPDGQAFLRYVKHFASKGNEDYAIQIVKQVTSAGEHEPAEVEYTNAKG